MKKIMIFCCTAALLCACGSSDERQAQRYLRQAEEAWKAGDYNSAKLQIDSIKILYPKAFEARHQGIRLLQHVELDEQQKSIAYLDSAMQAKQSEFKAIEGNYVLEKDTAYQEIGNYFAPLQTVEKNLNRTFLRAQVSEQGVMSLTSIYCSDGFIHHTSVKVTSGDTYAETPVSPDIYETTDLGWKIEKADYLLGSDGGVIGFIVLNKESPIRVEYRGDRTYKTTMSAADKKAIADVYTLAQILSSIHQIELDRREAQRKIDFITRKMQEAEAKDSEAK